jgi:hypothetical protein
MQFQFNFEGNLGDDAKFGTTPKGHARAFFTVIHTARFFRDGQWTDGPSVTIGVTCWRRLAENVAHLKKGDTVVVDLNEDLAVNFHNGRAYLQASARNVAVSNRFSAASSNKVRKNQDPEATSIPETGGYDTGADGGYVEPTDTPQSAQPAPAAPQPEYAGGQAA